MALSLLMPSPRRADRSYAEQAQGLILPVQFHKLTHGDRRFALGQHHDGGGQGLQVQDQGQGFGAQAGDLVQLRVKQTGEPHRHTPLARITADTALSASMDTALLSRGCSHRSSADAAVRRCSTGVSPIRA